MEHWRGGATPRTHGRCGPHSQLPQSHPGPSTDSSAHLSLVTAGLLTAITGSLTHHRSPSPQQPWKRVWNDPTPLSSPPPPAHEELRVFLDELFRKICRPTDIERVYNVLDQEEYTPKALADDRLNNRCIAELTGLPDGAILSMQTVAREWCENNKAKKQVF